MQDHDKLARDLRRLAAQLESIAAQLDDTDTAPKSIRALVAKRLSQRVCLSCEKQIAKQGRVIRGCHATCYYQLKRLLDKREVTNEELVRAGRLTEERSRGGRHSDAANKIRREVSKLRKAKK